MHSWLSSFPSKFKSKLCELLNYIRSNFDWYICCGEWKFKFKLNNTVWIWNEWIFSYKYMRHRICLYLKKTRQILCCQLTLLCHKVSYTNNVSLYMLVCIERMCFRCILVSVSINPAKGQPNKNKCSVKLTSIQYIACIASDSMKYSEQYSALISIYF